VRLRQLLIESFSGSQTVLSKRSGISLSQLGQYLGGYRNIGEKTARKIEEAAGKPIGWLDARDINMSLAGMGVRPVPIINYVQAGQWKAIGEHPLSEDPNEWLTTDLELSDQAFALEIKGDSMLPDFKEGDRVIIDPRIFPSPGDFVVSRNAQFEATFKKYRPRGLNEKGNEFFELVPLNLDYATVRSDMSPVFIIGTMVEHRRYRRK
jgi:SOS-response transcriptional repressor LexA